MKDKQIHLNIINNKEQICHVSKINNILTDNNTIEINGS
jgi:hypothetical protein